MCPGVRARQIRSAPMTDHGGPSSPPATTPEATLPQAWAARFAEAPDRPALWEARRGWVRAGDLDRASRRVAVTGGRRRQSRQWPRPAARALGVTLELFDHGGLS